MSFRWTLDLTDSQVALMQAIRSYEDNGFFENAKPFSKFSHYVSHIRVLDREGLCIRRSLNLKEIARLKREDPSALAWKDPNTGEVHPVLVLTRKGRLVLELIEMDIEAFSSRRIELNGAYHEIKDATRMSKR